MSVSLLILQISKKIALRNQLQWLILRFKGLLLRIEFYYKQAKRKGKMNLIFLFLILKEKEHCQLFSTIKWEFIMCFPQFRVLILERNFLIITSCLTFRISIEIILNWPAISLICRITNRKSLILNKIRNNKYYRQNKSSNSRILSYSMKQ